LTFQLTEVRFLYHNREVSYSSVLNRSVSARQQALYRSKGLDIERWTELQRERQSLSREIGRIKEDYDSNQAGKENEDNEESRDDASTPGSRDEKRS